MTKNIEICKAEEVGAQVLDILGTTAERQAVAALNAAFGLSIPLPSNEPGEITELPAAVSAHDRQLLAQTLGKPEPAATLSTTDPLATFVATLTRELYRHLAERQAVYPLADFPAWFPHDARNLAHLLQAVQSLSPRKISNGGATNDGIKDGESLAHILCGEYASITKLIDDNDDWVWDKRPNFASFPNLEELSVNAKLVDTSSVGLYLFDNGSHLKKLTFAKAKSLKADFINRVPSDCELYAPEAEYMYEGIGYPPACKVMYFPKLRIAGDGSSGDRWFQRTADLPTDRFVIGSLISGKITNWNTCNSPRLIDFEVGADGLGGLAISLDTSSWWNPTYVLSTNPTGNDLVPSGSTCQTNLEQFLVNFRDHIALRLTDQGSGLTLTLSQAVRNAIHAAESTYGIEDIIVNQKHWTLSPAPSA